VIVLEWFLHYKWSHLPESLDYLEEDRVAIENDNLALMWITGRERFFWKTSRLPWMTRIQQDDRQLQQRRIIR
jgi:hypothetical protein